MLRDAGTGVGINTGIEPPTRSVPATSTAVARPTLDALSGQGRATIIAAAPSQTLNFGSRHDFPAPRRGHTPNHIRAANTTHSRWKRASLVQLTRIETTTRQNPAPSREKKRMNDCTHNDERRAVLPVIVVCDVSGSMAGAPITTLHAEIDALIRGLSQHPVAASITRLSVVTFADSAHVHVPMSDVPQIGTIAAFEAGGATSYETVFDLLARALPVELKSLASRGHAVYRPTVFFFSDGTPTDDPASWRGARDRLTTNADAPNIVSFGIGDADATVIRDVAYGRGTAFLAHEGNDAASVLPHALDAILHATLDSFAIAPNVSNPMPPLRPPIPTEVPGFIPLDLVYLPATSS